MSSEETPRAVTSFGDLLRDKERRRDVLKPKWEDFPNSVGRIKESDSRDSLPAAIGISGKFAGYGKLDGERIAQWQIWIRPNDGRVARRLAGNDLVTAINALHQELTAQLPGTGATYTADFSVPNTASGDANVLRIKFRGTGGDHIDPWHINTAYAQKIEKIFELNLPPVFLQLWVAWTENRDVSEALAAQGIPVAARTSTQCGELTDVRNEIRASLPETARQTILGTAERTSEPGDPEKPEAAEKSLKGFMTAALYGLAILGLLYLLHTLLS